MRRRLERVHQKRSLLAIPMLICGLQGHVVVPWNTRVHYVHYLDLHSL